MSAPSGPPLVSVVVVNFNGRHHLERCLPSLFATVEAEFEVIVADNGSSDGSVEWLAERWPQARVLALGKNLGFGRANGRGVQVARGEFVAFLNNDTVVEPGWLAALLEPLRADPEVAASCATLRLLEFPELLNARGGTMTSAGYGYDIDFMVPVERRPVAHDTGPWRDVLFPTAAAALIRKREFLAAGGFDPAMFMYHEDVDLGVRLWLLGRRVVVCDRALVYHAFGGTSHQAHGLRWRERLGMRHNVRTLLKCYRPLSVLRAAKRIARIWLAHRAFGQAFWVCWWNLCHLPTTLTQRRRLQKRRVRNEGDLYRRGLITGAAWPPPSPQPPAALDTQTTAGWIVTATLLPGRHSAMGRLGAGWYGPDRLAGDTVRWTCGLAECWLRVEAGQAGHLAVELSLGAGAPATSVALTCNGERVEAQAGSGWTAVSLPARADAQGLLRVTVESPPWVPHPIRGDWDFRTLGCAVRAVRFRPAAPPPPAADPCVSVVVPTFNRWPILERALAALAAQTYRKFEAIVVDDGSTDGTWERLQAWQRANTGRIDLKVLHQENLKPGRARNLALRHAGGDLVLFLGDDII
ncbi:MAG: glycosyltransferase, partial [Thermoanaerobaculaceae bacterium]|nr:glycosyltransferase [Thermoanaerobaculaceae bacterium]